MFIIPVVNGVPSLQNIDTAPMSRVEYADIDPSTDATHYTDFKFHGLSTVKTGKEWAFAVKYDGDEDFLVWKAKVGENIIGTNTVCSGPSGKYVGKYYNYISSVPTQAANASSNNGMVSFSGNTGSKSPVPNSDYTDTSWRPLNDTDLKFQVYAARYAVRGNTNLAAINTTPGAVTTIGSSSSNTAAGTMSFVERATRYEYVIYDRRYSSKGTMAVGDKVWQKAPYYPGNTATPYRVSAITGSKTVTTSSFNFNTLFNEGTNFEYLVMISKDHNGAGSDAAAVRRVVTVDSNTAITLDESAPFTNASLYFYKAPVATIDRMDTINLYGTSEDLIILRDSNANDVVRFVNNAVESANIVAGGTGYSNTDYLTVGGFESVSGKVSGGYVAKANLVTNSTGGITALYFSNLGCGFVNSAAMTTTVSNSSGGTTAGSGLSLTYDVNATIYSEHAFSGSNGYVSHARLVNMSVSDFSPAGFIHNPLGTAYVLTQRLPYYTLNDTAVYGGKAYFLDDADAQNDFFVITPEQFQRHKFQKNRVLPSWSNELVINYTSGAVSNGAGTQANNVSNNNLFTSNATSTQVEAASNNDFVCVCIDDGSILFNKWVINNDYTNEHTNYGNAMAKGISTKVSFANDQFAEDVRVYLTAYRPVQTDIQVYLKIYNSHDPEDFNDKDWTRLEMKSGNGLYSSQTNDRDYVELTYGFQDHPNTAFAFSGSATLALNSSNIVGANTSWNTNATANLVVGDMVHIYQPLFPNNRMVSVVASVANDTQFTIQTPVSNNGMVGSGLIVEKVAYPHQAFNYVLNSNVVRYYNSALMEFDTYNAMQIKIVLLSADELNIPRVDDCRATGISA
jgi:hypothetical protein